MAKAYAKMNKKEKEEYNKQRRETYAKGKQEATSNKRDPRLIEKIKELLVAGETSNKKILMICKEKMPELITANDDLFSALVTYYKRKLGLIRRGYNSGPVKPPVSKIENLIQDTITNLTELQDIYTEAEDYKSAKIMLNLKRKVQIELMIEK